MSIEFEVKVIAGLSVGQLCAWTTAALRRITALDLQCVMSSTPTGEEISPSLRFVGRMSAFLHARPAGHTVGVDYDEGDPIAADPDAGPWVTFDAFRRDPPSILLAVAAATGVALGTSSLIVDERALMGLGRLVEPSALLEKIAARSRDAIGYTAIATEVVQRLGLAVR